MSVAPRKRIAESKGAGCPRCARVGTAVGGVEPSFWAEWIPIGVDVWPAIVEAWVAWANAQEPSLRCPHCDRAAVRTRTALLISRSGAPRFPFDCFECNGLFADHRGLVKGTRARYTASAPPEDECCSACGRAIEELSVDTSGREPMYEIAIAIARPAAMPVGPREEALAAIDCASCCAMLRAATFHPPESIPGKPGAFRFRTSAHADVALRLGDWDDTAEWHRCGRCRRSTRLLPDFLEIDGGPRR